MATKNFVWRMPPDLRELAQARADQEHRNLSDVANSALRAYLTGDDGGEARKHTIRRLAELEAELERTRAELEAARQGVIRVSAEGREKQARAGLRQVQEDRFIAALEAATKEDPATAPHLAALSGFSRFWCRDLARALTAAGFLAKVADGQWVPVPGKDLRAGMREARAIAQTGTARIAPHKREAPSGSTPATVPPVAAGKATDVAGAHSAAKGNIPHARRTASRERVIVLDRNPPVRKRLREPGGSDGAALAEASERAEALGAPLVAAKDVPRSGAAAVFKAGPDVDCLHENMRGIKGVCPDCKQWVTK